MKLHPFWLFLMLLFPLTSSFAQTPAPSGENASALGAAGKGEDSRSAGETFEWIKQQMKFSVASYDVSLRDGKGTPWHIDKRNENLQLTGCQLKILELPVATYRDKPKPMQRSAHITMDLSDLASATYMLDDGTKQFKYTPPVPTLMLKSHTKSMTWTRPKNYLPIDNYGIGFGADPSFGQAKIELLAQAFQHLADVCVRAETPAPEPFYPPTPTHTIKPGLPAPPPVTTPK
jgi:hypothetical protein